MGVQSLNNVHVVRIWYLLGREPSLASVIAVLLTVGVAPWKSIGAAVADMGSLILSLVDLNCPSN